MQPNLLVILTDQQSATMMSCAGNPWLRTPAMDRLAAAGTRFERAYCTDPVCVASRFSLMTGRMPGEIGLISNHTADLGTLPPGIAANGLGWMARRAGYRAVYAGKVHLPNLTAPDVGFDYLCRDERDELAAQAAAFLTSPPEEPFLFVVSFINPHDICYLAIQDAPEDPAAQAFVRRGIVECNSLNQALALPQGIDRPTFFATRCPPLPPNHEPEADEPEAIRRLVAARGFKQLARDRWDRWRWREYGWAYARLTERVDAQLGRVIDALEAGPAASRTVVIFTSDHGDMGGAHRLGQKSTLYEEVCRIPLIVREPGQAAAVDRAHPVSNGLDLLPTVADYLGTPPPRGLSGRSLRPLVAGSYPPDWRSWLPVESVVGRAVIGPSHKYAVYDLGETTDRLYDLLADPGETRDCRGTPAGQAALNNLRSAFVQAFGRDPRDPTLLDAAVGSA